MQEDWGSGHEKKVSGRSDFVNGGLRRGRVVSSVCCSNLGWGGSRLLRVRGGRGRGNSGVLHARCVCGL